ncbi:pre-toxin TG domain-containing protein [Enterococcus sp. LJL128]
MFKDYQINQEQKKVDILEKYQTFEETHANDFSEIASIGSQLTTTMSDLGKSRQFNTVTGTYTFSDCTNKEWYKKLKAYNDSCPEQRMEIVLENSEAAKHGVFIYKVYVDGKYNKLASENLMYATSLEGTKALGISTLHMGGEISNIYDIYRLFTGKDPVTGDKANRLEAGLWTMLFLLPMTKLADSVQSLRAGDKLLKGANLTADDLRILTNAGYFNDVAKISASKKIISPKETGGFKGIPDPFDEYLRWEKAEDRYNDIRKLNDDIQKIADNTNLPKEKIQRIKGHVFFNEHTLDHKIGVFDANPDMADAWERLIKGEFTQNDLVLLEHEYFESRFESLFKTNYRKAHDSTVISGRVWEP